MTGLDEFTALFGNITVLQVVEFLMACVFMFIVYKKVRDYLIKKHDTEKERGEQLKEALSVVRKYPELENEIQELRKMQEETSERLAKMDEDIKRRERNKLRDRLLQNYRYYTNQTSNPSLSWTKMEAEAFWELFRDYEDAGGDGYVHTEVQPAMERLTVLEVGTK